MLQERANCCASRFGILNFNCIVSWIRRFKARYNTVVGKIIGESSSVHQSCSTDLLYSIDEVFNADETGLFYKLMPDRTLKV